MKNHPNFSWKGVEVVLFSVEKAAEGGIGLFGIRLLKDAGIPARRAHSAYMGHVGIEVPKKFDKQADKILFG